MVDDKRLTHYLVTEQQDRCAKNTPIQGLSLRRVPGDSFYEGNVLDGEFLELFCDHERIDSLSCRDKKKLKI